jgi:hypothetical protein
MKRSFLPIKDYPVYNNHVDMLLLASKIFNGGSEKIPSIHTIFFDRKGIEYYILELEGDPETGKLIKDKSVTSARIPAEKARLNEIEKQYEKYKYQRMQGGFEEPTEMPLELLNQWYLTHARLSVYTAELEECRKHLDEFTDKVDEESASKVLQWGLRGFSKLRDGQISLLDGQHCSMTDDGIMIIDDERSPYSGMACSDYRKLAKQWISERDDADRKKLLRVQQAAREKGETIPQALPTKSMVHVSINHLPKWPEWAKNFRTKVTNDSTITK